MRKQKSFKYQETQQYFQTIRFGVKEYSIARDVDRFCSIIIHRPHPNPSQYAVLTSHETVYLFNHKFGVNKIEESNEVLLSELCEAKINLRLECKLPPLLHIKMKYSLNFQCLFLLLASGQIAVLTDELYLIGLVDIICCDSSNSIKHCLDFEYFEKEVFRSARKIKSGFFAFLFSDCLEVHEVQMSTNHKLSKFKPSFKFSLQQLSKCVEDREIKHPVSLSFFAFFRSHLFSKDTEKLNNTLFLCCNCLKEVYFYLIGKDTMKFEQTIRVARSQLGGAHVVDYEISALNKRFLIALSNGVVKAISFKQENLPSSVLYTIKISEAPVEQIYLQSLQKLLAFSKDNFLSMINLHTLSIEQRFKLGQSIQFQFVSEFHFISLGRKSSCAYNINDVQLKQDEFSRILILQEFNCKYKKIFQCNSDIVSYYLERDRDILQLSDNSLLINQHSGAHVDVIQTYLPPRSVSVRCINKNPYSSEDEYWILTEKSEIYKYQIGSSRSVNVSQVIELYRFIDKNGTEHRYIITFFCFLTKIVSIQYDSQTTEKQYKKNEASNEKLRPLCLGANTGQILIVSISSIDKIIMRMKSLSSIITNIIEIHPVLESQPSKGLIVYESKRSQKMIIVDLGCQTIPIEFFRVSTRNGWTKAINKKFFATINGGSFTIFYCQEHNHECTLYRQEHYNPGLLQNSKITAVSYCISQQQEYIVVGFSYGQILIYHLHENINQNTYLHLNLLYLIQNSKEQPVQFIRFERKKVYFNLGSFLVWNTIPEFEEKQNVWNTIQNYRLEKYKGSKQFNFEERPEKAKKQSIVSANQIEQELHQGLKLPQVKTGKAKQNRSSSVGYIKQDKPTLKPELMFHFPDIHLYRSLINRSIIH